MSSESQDSFVQEVNVISCRGVAHVRSPDPEKAIALPLRIPILPASEAVNVLVTTFGNGVRTVFCSLAQPGANAEVSCGALDFTTSPFGPLKTDTEHQGWRLETKKKVPCPLSEPDPRRR